VLNCLVLSRAKKNADTGALARVKHRTDCTESLYMEDVPQRMSDHADGPEAAGRQEENAGGARTLRATRKAHRHEERGMDPDNLSGLATALALHPSAAKKPRKTPARSSAGCRVIIDRTCDRTGGGASAKNAAVVVSANTSG